MDDEHLSAPQPLPLTATRFLLLLLAVLATAGVIVLGAMVLWISDEDGGSPCAFCEETPSGTDG